MKEREKFGSRLGFILVSAGCAIGLGNVWKFPYMAGKYGGAAFILIYLVFLVLLGLPVLVCEFAVGRASRQIDKGNLDIEIWERGSGYTKASGTGSCAAAIAAYRKGLMENRINVNQPGGMIQIDIKEDGTIFMTGTVGYIAEMSVAESFFS